MGNKFGKPWYIVVGTDLRSPNKSELERYAKLKNKEEELAKKMLKPGADIVKLSDAMEKAREQYKNVKYNCVCKRR